MAAFATYSATPASNTTIGGLNAAEGSTAAASVNNMLREICAEGRQLYDLVAAIDTSTLMPKSGGVFTGNITRSGSGAYLYHANSAQSGGAIYTQLSSAALPSSPAEGTVVFQYS